ncbi:MAG: hypothetical protein JJ863_02655 [Deltaproteobacteria bacterium]|nr:hypothetical protein [Deltaproteobacteria bacterium]
MNAETQPCAQCGRVVPTSSMVYNGQAQLICMTCESDAQFAEASTKSMIQTAISPPLLALVGTMMFCVPLLSLIVPLICGIMSMFASVQAIRMGMDNSRVGATDRNQPLLLISGILSALWALGIIGVQILSYVGMALMDRF